MELSTLPLSIHGNLEYINFRFQFNLLFFFLLLSYFYVFLTIVLTLRMVEHFRKPRALNSSVHVHRSVFLTFVWMQSANLLFYILDNVVFRIPPTGLLTSWLAASSPKLFLKLTYFFLLISNYFSTFFSFLFCLIRLIVVYFPGSQQKKISRTFVLYIPLSAFLPFLFTLFFLPATVYCRQISAPYPFGAVYFSYVGAWHNIYYDPFNVFVNFSAAFSILCINGALLRKIRSLMMRRTRSSRYLRAEVSLTLMTLTMNIPFLANVGMTATSFLDASKSAYTLLPRQVASDVGLVAVPWIFYLTHPMFRPMNPTSRTVSHGSSGNKIGGSESKV